MPLLFTYNCPRCASLFLIHVSKAVALGEINEWPGLWSMIDELEAHDGSLVTAEKIAADCEYQWVNTRLTEAAFCRICGQRVDFLSFLRESKAKGFPGLEANDLINADRNN